MRTPSSSAAAMRSLHQHSHRQLGLLTHAPSTTTVVTHHHRRHLTSPTIPTHAAAATAQHSKPTSTKPSAPKQRASSTPVNSSGRPTTILRPINPKSQFRIKMRQLRKQYFAESIIARREQEAEAKAQEEARRVARERLREEIRQYKLAAAAERRSGDEPTGPAGPGAKANAALEKALRTAEEEKAVGEMVNETLSPFDPKVLETPGGWERWVEARRKLRFLSELQRVKRVRKERLGSLMYLFHATQEFVTYRNLDSKLTEAFLGARVWVTMNKTYNYSLLVDHVRTLEKEANTATHPALVISAIREVARAAEKEKLTTAAESESVATGDVVVVRTRPVTGYDAEKLLLKPLRRPKVPANLVLEPTRSQYTTVKIERPPVLWPPSSGGEAEARSRVVALKDALEGTVSLRPGVDTVMRWLKDKKNHDLEVLRGEVVTRLGGEDHFEDEAGAGRDGGKRDFRRVAMESAGKKAKKRIEVNNSLLESMMGSIKYGGKGR
ncbi:hypothetical protein HDU96_008015 [Phlyctochytrium bullatum]|nr:hypothetical protein HDU96_008015 [Phlyctochytrium bullatum]